MRSKEEIRKYMREYFKIYYFKKLKDLCKCGNIKGKSSIRCNECYHSKRYGALSRLGSLKEKNKEGGDEV